MDDLEKFSRRLHADWLDVYCQDDKRNYDPRGFNATSITVADVDARDCMLAIDLGVVYDTGGGRYWACRSSTREVLFWEGHKTKSPRQITLWLEPVITFAALARLHLVHGWPKDALGMQPRGAFDFAAFGPSADQPPWILGEVKKSSAKLDLLRDELLKLSNGLAIEAVSNNSAKKWRSLLTTRPKIVWLLGSNEKSYVYTPHYSCNGCALQSVSSSVLALSAA